MSDELLDLTVVVTGASSGIGLASEPAERLNSGGYYVKRQLRVPGGPAGDAELAARLWAASAKAVGV
jgi:hypothetical protein